MTSLAFPLNTHPRGRPAPRSVRESLHRSGRWRISPRKPARSSRQPMWSSLPMPEVVVLIEPGLALADPIDLQSCKGCLPLTAIIPDRSYACPGGRSSCAKHGFAVRVVWSRDHVGKTIGRWCTVRLGLESTVTPMSASPGLEDDFNGDAQLLREHRATIRLETSVLRWRVGHDVVDRPGLVG